MLKKRGKDRYKLRVGIAQISCVIGDVAANFKTHKEYIKQAVEAELDLVLFPELSLTGYVGDKRVLELAEMRQESECLQALSQLAPDMAISVGFIEEGEDGLIYNSQAMLQNGGIASVQRKCSLPNYGPHEEGKSFSQGHKIGIVDGWSPWLPGTFICNDLWNPGLVHRAMMKSCNLVLCPLNSGLVEGGRDYQRGWEILCSYISMIYGCYVLMANCWGPQEKWQFWGYSRVYDPVGQVVARAEEGGTKLIIHELDYQKVRQARFELPTIRDSLQARYLWEKA